MLDEIEGYLNRIAELEQKVEEMEQSSSVGLGFLIGVILYYQWGSWFISVCIAAAILFVAWKYLADKPFTKNI